MYRCWKSCFHCFFYIARNKSLISTIASKVLSPTGQAQRGPRYQSTSVQSTVSFRICPGLPIKTSSRGVSVCAQKSALSKSLIPLGLEFIHLVPIHRLEGPVCRPPVKSVYSPPTSSGPHANTEPLSVTSNLFPDIPRLFTFF